MKKAIFVVLFLSAGLLFSKVNAQVKVNVNINVGTQPTWGPQGYDHVEYYYMPDIDVYYYVPQHQFIYLEAGRWVFAASLPSRCGNYDLYRGYKVILNEPRPYLHHDVYHVKYAKYRGHYGYQQPLRGPEIREYRDDDDGPGHGHGHGHAYGHYKNHGRDD